MKDCPELHEKSWYNKAQETGLQNAGEAGRASYSGNFETLIFFIFPKSGRGKTAKTNEGK